MTEAGTCLIAGAILIMTGVFIMTTDFPSKEARNNKTQTKINNN